MPPSRTVVEDRLKHGQCIHCGIQTHQVIRKSLGKKEKIPLNIPGAVEHGRCLRESCQQAGINVAFNDSVNTGGRSGSVKLSGKTVGMASSITGALMSVCEIPGGELLSGLGQAISQSSSSTQEPSSGSFSSFGDSSYMDNYQQIMAQQSMQSQQLLAQMQGQYQQQYQQYLEQSMLESQRRQQVALQQISQAYGQPTPQTAVFSCGGASPGQQLCPMNHPAILSISQGHTCDYCLGEIAVGMAILECQICDWATCATGDCFQRSHDLPAIQCPQGHMASAAKVPDASTGLEFVCDVCNEDLPGSSVVYACAKCEGIWTACPKHFSH